MMRGTLKRWSSTAGACASTRLAVEARDFGVGTQDVLDWERVGRRRDAGGVEAAHGVDMLEDGRQLAGVAVDLTFVESEPGEARDVAHLFRPR